MYILQEYWFKYIFNKQNVNMCMKADVEVPSYKG